MRYMGGKCTARGTISKHVLSHGLPVLEPFVGGANLPDLWPEGSVASDIVGSLIDLYEKVRVEGVDWLPDEVSEATYKELLARFRAGKIQRPIDAFVLFGCSFGGKHGQGYARSRSENFVAQAKNALRRLHGRPCRYVHRSFFDIPVSGGFALYLDPPYYETTAYKAREGTIRFDHGRFVKRAREWAEAGAPVYISEYRALDRTWVDVDVTLIRGRVGLGISNQPSRLFRVDLSR